MIRALLILVFCTPVCFGQKISNASFEGTASSSVTPPSWYACNSLSSPDTQPGAWNVTKAASDGNTYISLVTRGDNTVEAIGTQLSSAFKVNRCYKLSLDLAHAAEFYWEGIFYPPVKLNIYLSKSSCEKNRLLWTSPVIANKNWENYDVIFSVEDEFSVLILEAVYSGSNAYYGSILIDNLRLESSKLDLGTDAVLCKGEKLTIETTAAEAVIKWSTGSTQSTIEVTVAGIYWAEVLQNNCLLRDSVQVTYKQPIQLELGSDVILCAHQNLKLDVSTPWATYQWNTGSIEPTMTIYEAGEYGVVVDNGCDTAEDVIKVLFRENCCEVSAPNVFTPNGDGVNETFEVSTMSNVVRYDLRIFNSWGKMVFRSDVLNKFWNGKSNDSEVSPGVYFWYAKIMCIEENKIIDNSYKGVVSVLK